LVESGGDAMYRRIDAQSGLGALKLAQTCSKLTHVGRYRCVDLGRTSGRTVLINTCSGSSCSKKDFFRKCVGEEEVGRDRARAPFFLLTSISDSATNLVRHFFFAVLVDQRDISI